MAPSRCPPGCSSPSLSVHGAEVSPSACLTCVGMPVLSAAGRPPRLRSACRARVSFAMSMGPPGCHERRTVLAEQDRTPAGRLRMHGPVGCRPASITVSSIACSWTGGRTQPQRQRRCSSGVRDQDEGGRALRPFGLRSVWQAAFVGGGRSSQGAWSAGWSGRQRRSSALLRLVSGAATRRTR